MYSWLGGVLRCNGFQPGMEGSTLVPPPAGEDSDWDTTLVVHEDMLTASLERRHSGWEAVEKKWAEKKKKQQQQEQQLAGSKLSSELTREASASAAMSHFPYPQMSIPSPHIEFDFRMKIVLNSQFASVSVNDGFKKLTTVTEGMWSGHFGHGIVVSGEQESQDISSEKAVTTQVESFQRLQTGDEPPA
ncbi:hypothetical protein Hte_008710 [Hypoxylon texense]